MRILISRAVAVLAATALSVEGAKHYRPFREPPISAPSYRQKGPENAPVLIAEFSDFECPACKAAEPPIHQALALYGDRVHFIFKDFPLEHNHPWAKTAAIAAECAGKQGRFWPYHDLLYENQETWSSNPNVSPDPYLLAYAKETRLDMPAFQACRADPSVAAAIEADRAEGDERWVNATPTFFINGKRFVGAMQFSTLGTFWIDKILKNEKQ